jgi:hypothetical protein
VKSNEVGRLFGYVVGCSFASLMLLTNIEYADMPMRSEELAKRLIHLSFSSGKYAYKRLKAHFPALRECFTTFAKETER